MNRAESFLELKKHPYYARYYLKLSKAELGICFDFIAENGCLGANEWAFKVNRLYLGATDKPRNLSIITDLLTSIK